MAAVAGAATSDRGAGVRAKATVRALAALGPRPAGSAAERRASELVAVRLGRLGYRVVVQRFELPRGGTSQNVVGLTPGPIRHVVVAHVDGVRASPAANDNASGVAALLEIARERPAGLLVAALGAEERVETGSTTHLGSARLLRGFSAAGRARIRLAVSLDMVGVGGTLAVRGVEPAPNRSARLLLSRARRLGVPAAYVRDPGHSDHAELTRGGLAAAWLQWRPDPCWHSPCDVPGRVSAARLTTVIRLVGALAGKQ